MATTMPANVLEQIKTIKEDMGKLPQIDLDNIRTFEIESLEIGGTKLKSINVGSNNPADVAAFAQVLATLQNQSQTEAHTETVQAAPQVTPPSTASADKNQLSQIFPIYLRHRDKAGLSGHSLDDFTSAYNLLLDAAILVFHHEFSTAPFMLFCDGASRRARQCRGRFSHHPAPDFQEEENHKFHRQNFYYRKLCSN